LLEKIEFIGPQVGLDELVHSITVEITDRLGAPWDEWYGLLIKYKQREGNCRVFPAHKEGDFRLGSWVRHQRKSKDALSAERCQRLDRLGFDWDPIPPFGKSSLPRWCASISVKVIAGSRPSIKRATII
jgi:hypothetical protein